MTQPTTDDLRVAELAESLTAVQARLAAAAVAANRDPADITLIAVTKTYPAADAARLAALGVRDLGENRDQEAAGKAEAVASLGLPVTWHFIGQLQRNKCRSVVRYADVVHSVDSARLARVLGAAAARYRETPLDVLVQVSIDGDPRRGGVPRGDLDRVLAAVEAQDGLCLRGLMAVAPVEWRPEAAFEVLQSVSYRVREEYPRATWLSAGMSGDAEQAIAFGSTHVRVGSALLGNRSPLR